MSEPDETIRRDLEVVTRCLRDADTPAWDEFFARFGPLMRIWIRRKRRTGPPEDLEDIYQGIVLKILSNSVLPGFDPNERPFRAFFHMVVVNYIVDQYRKSRNTEPLKEEPSLSDELARIADDSRPRSYEQLHALIGDHLAAAGLPQSTLVIYNALLDERPSSEIAEMAGVSESTVSRRRTRLFAICRALLGLPEPAEKTEAAAARKRHRPRRTR